MADKKCSITWAFFVARYPKLQSLPCPTVTLNGRFSKTAGCNHSEQRIIELSTKFFIQFPDNMYNTIIPHEVCHQVDFDLNGWYDRKPHHGKSWQILMVQYGLTPDAYHTMELK